MTFTTNECETSMFKKMYRDVEYVLCANIFDERYKLLN